MIIIEGIIGVGKTTLGEVLARRLGIALYHEFANEYTMPILDKFYVEKNRWSFLSQIHFLANRLTLMLDANLYEKHVLSDRSIFGDSIFAELLFEDNAMTEEEYKTYKMLFDNISKLSVTPELVIYLDCSIEVALQRINQRSRDCEKSMSREYLEKLNEKYLIWYKNYNDSPKIFINTDNINICTKEGEDYMVDVLKKHIQNRRYGKFIHSACDDICSNIGRKSYVSA